MFKRLAICLLALVAAGFILEGTPAFASTSASSTNTVAPTLVVNVTVQKAISLTLATGTGCAVSSGSPGSDYSMSFGTVDALAIANGCGSKFAPTTPGTSNAVYYTDYKVTPVFTSQAVTTNTVTAYVSTGFVKANLSIVQSTSQPNAIGDLSAMSTSPTTQTTVSTGASGTATTNYVGVSVAPTNAAGLTGSDAATITYTLTAQ